MAGRWWCMERRASGGHGVYAVRAAGNNAETNI